MNEDEQYYYFELGDTISIVDVDSELKIKHKGWAICDKILKKYFICRHSTCLLTEKTIKLI